MQFVKILINSLVVLVFVSACGSSDEDSIKETRAAETEEDLIGGSSTMAGACSSDVIETWAYQNLQDYYLFYDQVPTVDPTSYPSPESLVEDLRVLPFDRFSRIAVASEEQEVFVEGKTFGIGSVWQWDNENNLRVGAVYRDSPISRAGIQRGDILVSIGGVTLEQMTTERYQEFVGTREAPGAAVWTFEDAATGALTNRQLSPDLFDINTVLHSETITLPDYSENIGYLVFDSFLGTSEAELDEAIATFRDNNIRELILDLRYNGGGYVTVATKLASQIAGSSTDGKMLMEYRHNDKYTDFDFTIDFERVEDSLNLDRLIVLTTDYTASASELVISALSPYIEVVTIGSTTTGKPYISFGNEFCDRQMHALQAEGFNANNVSVYGGITPSCGSIDDLTKDFGYLSSEGMLNDALDYLVHGRCETPTLASTPGIQNDGTQQTTIINAFTRPGSIGGSRGDRSVLLKRAP